MYSSLITVARQKLFQLGVAVIHIKLIQLGGWWPIIWAVVVYHNTKLLHHSNLLFNPKQKNTDQFSKPKFFCSWNNAI